SFEQRAGLSSEYVLHLGVVWVHGQLFLFEEVDPKTGIPKANSSPILPQKAAPKTGIPKNGYTQNSPQKGAKKSTQKRVYPNSGLPKNGQEVYPNLGSKPKRNLTSPTPPPTHHTSDPTDSDETFVNAVESDIPT